MDNKKRRLLIVSGIQYGYLVDYLHHACNMSGRFDITYLCMDEGNERIPAKGFRVVYVTKRSRINRRLDMRGALRNLLRSGQRFDLVLTDFNLSATLLFPLLRKLAKAFVFDIRTLDVSPSPWRRRIKNYLLRLTALRAPYVTAISRPVARALRLPDSRVPIVPLGFNNSFADLPPKTFDTLRLLYIGTFNSRHIDQTVRGLALFLHRHSEWRSRLRYDIVGAGPGEDKIKEALLSEGLDDIVTLHGYVPNDRAASFFDAANVGVSYVPCGPAFDLQPPTKTYEYLAAGMPVIATSTRANTEIMNPGCGEMCDSTPEDFAEALGRLAQRLGQFDSEAIRGSVSGLDWRSVSDSLADILSKIPSSFR